MANYPILDFTGKKREDIRIVPEECLDSLTVAELSNLRKGIPYKFTITDTKENRENFEFKSSYIQMVAYSEGWEFNPENLQVKYVPQGTIGEFHSRIYPVEGEGEEVLGYELSDNKKLGFRVYDEENYKQIDPQEVDSLSDKINRLWKR